MLLNKIKFDIEEVGVPIPFRWGKCKLATVSFGHGITTTTTTTSKRLCNYCKWWF